jgi:hypothetical protein
MFFQTRDSPETYCTSGPSPSCNNKENHAEKKKKKKKKKQQNENEMKGNGLGDPATWTRHCP